MIKNLIIAGLFLSAASLCSARTINIYGLGRVSASGGGTPTGSIFVSTGASVLVSGTTAKLGFPSLPTAGNGLALLLLHEGTTLPSSVVDQDSTALTKSTSIIDATAGSGNAIYVLQSLTTTGSTTTVTLTFGSSVHFLAQLVQFSNQNSPAVDVSTGGLRASLTIASTTPVTAATCQLMLGVYQANASNPGQTITVPAGWTKTAESTDGSVTQVGAFFYKSGAGLASVAVGLQTVSVGSGNRSIQSITGLK